MATSLRRRKELDPCFEWQDDGQILCTTCRHFMQASSARNHLLTKVHITRVQRAENVASMEQQEDRQYQALYDDDTHLQISMDTRASATPPAIYQDSGSEETAHIDSQMRDYATTYLSSLSSEESGDYEERQRRALDRLALDLTLLYLRDNENSAKDNDATLPEDHVHESGSDPTPADDSNGEPEPAANPDWAPYPNRTMFFVDLLDSLPRLRLSDAQLGMILWVMSQCGAQNVPSLYKLRQWQTKLQTQCGTETLHHRSSLGNIFYSNNICGTIAMDFAKPTVAPQMRAYPEISSKGIQEVRQAGRFREIPLNHLTPMYANGLEHFYVNELAELDSGRLFVPALWHYRDDQLCASGYACHLKEGNVHVDTQAMVLVQATKFRKSMPTLIAEGRFPGFHEDSEHARSQMPNQLRALAGGAELYSVFLYIWADDVSGNVSKQYNKHNNIYVANMNLPPELLQQEFFVHFFSTSPHASTAEQFSAIKDQMNSTLTHPFPAYNAATRTPCKFRLFPLAFPADNPQQSDECSHLTGQATMNCRKCKNRRRPAPDGSDMAGDWYGKNYEARIRSTLATPPHDLWQPGEERNAAGTLNAIKAQLRAACNGFVTNVKEQQSESGVKDRIAEYWIQQLLERAKELKSKDKTRSQESITEELMRWLHEQPGDKWNVLLDWLGVDPHKDTPVELLHTVLLGIVKYMWHMLHTPWTKSPQHSHLFTIRLQATDTLGLSIPPIRAAYMYQYRNGLIGKHFKTLAQTTAFHVHDITSDTQFRLVKATGQLCALLWYPVIKDMESYLADLDILIKNVLAAYASIDPLRILEKVKIHLLAHLIQDIRRFGPAVRFSTEIFECFNAIFRMCSVLSNHLAPSRDIARSLASMDRLKHIVSGGFWHDGSNWVQAGVKVRQVLHEHPIVQRHLGWILPRKFTPCSVAPIARAKCMYRLLTADELTLLGRGALFTSDEYTRLQHTRWCEGLNVTSHLGDTCPVNAWVAFNNYDKQQSIGRVASLLVPETDDVPSLVSLSAATVGSQLHPILEMPVLKIDGQTMVRSSDVLFIVNVQHDCITSKCTASGSRMLQQERANSGVQVTVWQHTAVQRYVINTHALHNAAHLRELLPRHLTKPRATWTDFQVELSHVTRAAIEAQIRKEAQRKSKAAETRRRNKERTIADAAPLPVVGDRPGEHEDDDQDTMDIDADRGSMRTMIKIQWT